MANFPVIDIDPRRFPMPTLEQGSPFGGVLANAIAKRLAMTKAKEAEAELPYAGLSKLADILSKSAYSNAVTPQYQSKLLGIPGAIANLKHPQTTLNALENYGNVTNQTGNNLQDYINKELLKISQNKNQESPGFLSSIGHKISNLFTGNNQAEENAVPAQAAMVANGVSNVSPSATSIPSSVNPSGRSPESVAYSLNQSQSNKVTAKGTSQGTKEGEQQTEYGPLAQGVISQQKSLDSLHSVYNEPVIKKIANVPFATGKSISWYKQTGNEVERDAIGRMETAESNFIGSSFALFGPRVTNNDLLFLQRMKPNENDPINVRNGKISEIEKYTKSKAKQIQLANKYMEDGDNQADAEFKADAKIRLDKERQNSYKKYLPKSAENKNSNLYAKTPEEWHSGKQAEDNKVIDGKRFVKLGGKWYPEV